MLAERFEKYFKWQSKGGDSDSDDEDDIDDLNRCVPCRPGRLALIRIRLAHFLRFLRFLIVPLSLFPLNRQGAIAVGPGLGLFVRARRAHAAVGEGHADHPALD